MGRDEPAAGFLAGPQPVAPGAALPLWSLGQNVSAAAMRATVDEAAARADARGKRQAASPRGSWDGPSLAMGVLIGSALGGLGALGATRMLRARHEPPLFSFSARSLSGGGGGLASLHPAANRLMAAAGTHSREEDILLRRMDVGDSD